jgi:transposase
MVIGMNEEIWRELLREQQLQMLYSVRSERLLMQEIDYSMLFRWFVGPNLDEGCGTRPASQES